MAMAPAPVSAVSAAPAAAPKGGPSLQQIQESVGDPQLSRLGVLMASSQSPPVIQQPGEIAKSPESFF